MTGGQPNLDPVLWFATVQPDMPDAVCVDHQDLPWIPDRGGDRAALHRLRAICHGCPEREPCLTFALSAPSLMGVWGGTTTRERQAMRAGRGAL